MPLNEFYRVIAPYYDGDYAGLIGGEEFYVSLARECGGPVFEMACGTGRILLPIARAGFRIDGMDASPDMLNILRAKLECEPEEVRARVRVVEGDIRTDDAGTRYPLVIAAGNTPHSFLERADQRAWLRNARRHIAPGGSLCFDVFQFDYRYLLRSSEEWGVQVDRVEPDTGHRVRRFFRIDQEPEFQRFTIDLRWLTEDKNGGVVFEETASVQQRWFTRGELECLLELEGFRIMDYWGSFERQPFGKGSTEQIIRATLL